MYPKETPSPDTVPEVVSTSSAIARTRRSFWQRCVGFVNELFSDYDFDVYQRAIKGGVSAVVIAGAASFLLYTQLPLVIGAAGLAACAGFGGIGLYGIFLGVKAAGKRLRNIYSRNILGREPAPKAEKPAAKPWHQKLAGHPRIKSLLEKPLIQKLLNSAPLKQMRAIAGMPQHWFLESLGVAQGFLFFGKISIVVAAASVYLFPVMATIGTVLVMVTLATSIAGVARGLFNATPPSASDTDIRTSAIKGGVSTLILAGVAAGFISSMQLPLIVTVAGISACAGLTGIGLYGSYLGAQTAGKRLRHVFHSRRAIGRGTELQPKKPGVKSWHKKLAEQPRIKRLFEKPVVQKFLNNPLSKAVRAIVKMPSEIFLNGLAMNGSVAWGISSAIILATTIATFPVSLLTVAGLTATAIVIGAGSGVIGNMIGIGSNAKGMISALRASKKSPPVKSPDTASRSPVGTLPDLKPSFTEAASRQSVPPKGDGSPMKLNNPSDLKLPQP